MFLFVFALTPPWPSEGGRASSLNTLIDESYTQARRPQPGAPPAATDTRDRPAEMTEEIEGTADFFRGGFPEKVRGVQRISLGNWTRVDKREFCVVESKP